MKSNKKAALSNKTSLRLRSENQYQSNGNYQIMSINATNKNLGISIKVISTETKIRTIIPINTSIITSLTIYG